LGASAPAMRSTSNYTVSSHDGKDVRTHRAAGRKKRETQRNTHTHTHTHRERARARTAEHPDRGR